MHGLLFYVWVISLVPRPLPPFECCLLKKWEWLRDEVIIWGCYLPPDVSVLGNLPYLIFLDVSYNKLTTILDFHPPKNLLVYTKQHSHSKLFLHVQHETMFSYISKSWIDVGILSWVWVCDYLYLCFQEVNYSHNEIEEICDLSAHCSLTRLTLDCILIRHTVA